MRRVTVDCGSISTIIHDALLPMGAALFTLVSMFLIMWRLDPALTLLSLAVLPLMVSTFRTFAGPMLERSYEQQEIEGGIYSILEGTLSAMPVVTAFQGEGRANFEFRRETQNSLAAALKLTEIQVRFKILMGFSSALGTAAILWVGAQHVLTGELTVGTILVFISYLGLLYAPLESIMYSSSTVSSAAGSARRVIEVLEQEPEVREAPRAHPLPTVRGTISLDHVSFAYEPGRSVLRDVSLQAQPGETIAIVGPTGSGKSTLVSLIPRFVDPSAGRVLIDGHDLRTVRLASVRRQVAIVLQEPFLFPLSIADNIAYGRPEASRQQIQAAAAAANAASFIERLPEGYETVIGERGATLSGGERQRLAIARAVLKDAPILILDEPTSALDAETEEQLMEALERLMAGRTTFLIAHRLSTIRGADRIVVLRDGEIVEEGTHPQLLALHGLYARAYNLQHSRRPAGTRGTA